jgi:hypothetical protein
MMRRVGCYVAHRPPSGRRTDMNTSSKFGITALVGLAAMAWLSLDGDGSARMLQTRNHSVIECNSRDPLSPCAADFNFARPVGDGLVITLMEDFF